LDVFFELVAVGVILFLFLAPIIVLVRSHLLARRTESLEHENNAVRNELRAIANRISELEKALKEGLAAAGPSSQPDALPGSRRKDQCPAGHVSCRG
jgi:hypothetical protein